MKVLFLGGSGVLSTDIVRKCIDLGYDTYVLNRGNSNSELPKNVKFIISDVRNIEIFKASIGEERFDVVIDFLSLNKRHLETSFSLLKDRCTQYIFISSACVFERENGEIIKENSKKPNQNLQYGKDKYDCEEYIIEEGEKANCKYTIVRPYITYGDTRIPFGIMPLAKYHWGYVARILAGKPIFIWDDGNNYCTLTHTTDFADIFVQLLLNPKAYNTDFNLVGDECVTWNEMLHTLFEVVGKTTEVVSIPSETIAEIEPTFSDFIIGDRAIDAIFDNAKIKSATDFKQAKTMKEGIAQTIEYYRSNNYLSGIDYGFDGRMDRLIGKFTGKTPRFVDYLGSATMSQRIEYERSKRLSKRSRALLGKAFASIHKIIHK